MSLAAWLTFLVAAVLISVSPGAGAINTMSNGMRYGVRRSLPAIMGLLTVVIAAQYLFDGLAVWHATLGA